MSEKVKINWRIDSKPLGFYGFVCFYGLISIWSVPIPTEVRGNFIPKRKKRQKFSRTARDLWKNMEKSNQEPGYSQDFWLRCSPRWDPENPAQRLLGFGASSSGNEGRNSGSCWAGKIFLLLGFDRSLILHISLLFLLIIFILTLLVSIWALHAQYLSLVLHEWKLANFRPKLWILNNFRCVSGVKH